MKQRCLNENSSDYKDYGGRGISICSEWMDIEKFIIDMGIPQKGDTIERLNSNGNYCLKNCIWASRKEQSNNRRTTIKLDGIPMAKWCSVYNLSYNLVYKRYRKGMSPKQILKTPILYKNLNGQKCKCQGCNNPVKTRKMCNKHYLRWWLENKKKKEL
ncbi:MAG: hypothetical protein GQ540_03755 [Lutibacter sp.]|uniref:hypothetical protein n=1 Tax=Lutibacter sp. TaxID=1925666 RepID=UPI0019F77685|nr:hypothetical protein [Lutibacter sp.]NOR27628.1 hypothetical protein [Lutibacter sp.]